jgi:hypothetical protein
VDGSDDADDEREADGVLMFSCNRSKGDPRRSKFDDVSGLFRFLEIGFLRMNLSRSQ